MEQVAELNIEQASTDLAAELGVGEASTDDLDAKIDGAADTAPATGADKGVKDDVKAGDAPKGNGEDADAATAAAIEALPVPQSWKKEMHEHWGKMPRQAQEYYLQREQQMLQGLEGYKTDAELARGLKPILTKHEALLRQQGVQVPQALEYLFNSHAQLSTGTEEQRRAYLEKVANHYGLTTKPAAGVNGEQAPALPPEIKAVIERQERIEAAMLQEQNQRYEAVRATTAKEVEAFASDPKHAYFDEVADDIAALIKVGHSLPDAYEKAVWANPVTRQKELARIQQADAAAAAEKAKEAAKAAKKATSTNVKGRDTTRSPTGSRATLDNLDEVLRETADEMKARI